MPFPEQAQQFLSFIGLLRIRDGSSNPESPKVCEEQSPDSRIFSEKSLRKAPASSSPSSFGLAGALLLFGSLSRADAGFLYA